MKIRVAKSNFSPSSSSIAVLLENLNASLPNDLKSSDQTLSSPSLEEEENDRLKAEKKRIKQLNKIRDWISLLKKSVFKFPRTLAHLAHSLKEFSPALSSLFDILAVLYLLAFLKIFSQLVSSIYEVYHIITTKKASGARLMWKLYLPIVYLVLTCLMVAIPLLAIHFACLALSHSFLNSSYDSQEKGKKILSYGKQITDLKSQYYYEIARDQWKPKDLEKLVNKINELQHEVTKLRQDFYNKLANIGITVLTVFFIGMLVVTSSSVWGSLIISIAFSALVIGKFLHNLMESRQKEPEYKPIIHYTETLANKQEKNHKVSTLNETLPKTSGMESPKKEKSVLPNHANKQLDYVYLTSENPSSIESIIEHNSRTLS